MDIALQQAWDVEVHIVMVQEPWAMQKSGEHTTKSHTGFDSYIPVGNSRPRSRPRAIVFVRKELKATQSDSNHPSIKPDIRTLCRAGRWTDIF